MRVLVQSYTKLNVGDDLFLHTLFTRYPDVKFVLNVYDRFYSDYRRFRLAYKNVYVNGKYSVLYRAKRKMGIVDIDKSRIKNFDAVVHMAGSIFMENSDNSEYDTVVEREVDYFHRHKIPVYFLSCNFGPYYTQEYKKRKENMFKKCADVCFRDKYSYELFAHLSNVRYAPDAVFSMQPPEVIPKKRTLGVSVINLSKRPKLRKFTNEYKNLIIKIAKEYLACGYDVYLFAFCCFEGDGEAVDDIAGELGQYGVSDKVHPIKYDGRLEDFLKLYMSMEQTVCTRFHSMILSALMEIPMLPLIYSSKVSNVVNDLRLCDYTLQINDLWGDVYMNEPVNVSEISRCADEVFGMLDIKLKKITEKG